MIVIMMVLIYLALRGVCEGMVMTRYTDPMADPEAQDDMDGVRVHRWFRWYHLLCVMRDGALIGVVVVVGKWGMGIMGGMGGMVLGWELSELGYSWARYRRWIGGHENVLGVYSLDSLAAVWAIHTARVLIGLALIAGGVR